jgi:hypothetical protein
MIFENESRTFTEAGDCPHWSGKTVNSSHLPKLFACGLLAAAMSSASPLNAQHLTLEGQTGGFLTPTAYVVDTAKGKFFSHPAVGVHYIDASKVIGQFETLSITEGFANRAEVGYSRSIHQLGNSVGGSATNAADSDLWHYNGMNIFHGKVVGIKDGQFGPWTPGVAVGGVVRTNDRFVSGAAGQDAVALYDQGCLANPACPAAALLPIPAVKSYTNGDAYISVTKTWAKPPVPFLVNVGWKATNAAIFGIGGQSTRFGGLFYGGLGIPLPLGHGVVAVPSAGFTQQPKGVVGLGHMPPAGIPLVSGRADLPTTLDYAVRVTQREHPHFSFDIGIGQVAGNIGAIPTGLPSPYPPSVPVNLEARKVVGMGLSYRY